MLGLPFVFSYLEELVFLLLSEGELWRPYPDAACEDLSAAVGRGVKGVLFSMAGWEGRRRWLWELCR